MVGHNLPGQYPSSPPQPGAAVPNVEQLKAQLNEALGYLLSQTDPTAVFRVWLGFRALWMRVDDAHKGELLGHLAVLWQELDRQWTIRREAAPLLNQFINVGFQGIHRAIPRSFAPEIAPGPMPWYGMFAQMAQGFGAGQSAHQDGLFDVLLTQYEVLYAPTVAAETDQLLVEQLAALELARQCRRSNLVLPEQALANTQSDANAVRFLNWLARTVAVGGVVAAAGQAHTVDPGWLLQQLVPSARPTLPDVLQLFGFWAARAPWLSRFLQRHCPTLAPRIVEPAPPEPHALPAHHGCDLYFLLAGARGTGTKDWMFASEAACATTQSQVYIGSLGGVAVDEARGLWASGTSLPSDEPRPALAATRVPEHVCRLQCWDLPSIYLEGLYDKQALAARVSSAHGGQGDAAHGREWIRLLESQRPSAAVLLIDLKQWLSVSDPNQRAAMSSPYFNAIDRVDGMLRAHGGQPQAYPWVFVFNNASWLADAMYHEDTDSQLRMEYVSSLRGSSGRDEGLISVHGDDPMAILREALSHPLALKSPAFAARVTEDISAVKELLAFLTEHGFRSVSFAYSATTAAEANAWGSLQATWSFLENWLTRATMSARQAFLKQRFSSNVEQHLADTSLSGPMYQGLSGHLSRLSGVADAAASQGNTNLASVWSQLESLVGRQRITPQDFSVLWQQTEHSLSLTRSSASSAEAVAVALLAELGIPNQPLASFQADSFDLGPELSGALMASLPTDEERASLVGLVAKPQPLSVTDPDVSGLRQFHAAYDAVVGSLSSHCILRDRSANDAERALLYEHGSKTVVQFLFDPRVSLDDKTWLILALRNFQPAPWRQVISMARREKNDAKFNVIAHLWREVFVADIAIVHLLRMTARVGELVGAGGEAAMFDERRRQIRGLLEAGGWDASKLADDISTGDAALRRLIDLWKDYYRNFGPHRTKRREELCVSLKQEYDQLRKPMASPVVHASLPKEKALDLEKSVYLAHHCVELLSRFPAGSSKPTPADLGERVSSTGELRDYAHRAEILLRDYCSRRARFLLAEVAFTLEQTQWLRGVGGHRELIGRDLLAHANAPAEVSVQALSRAIDEIISRPELWTAQAEPARISALPGSSRQSNPSPYFR